MASNTTSNKVLLSIIIPSFRQPSLLRGALQSIEKQTFKNYEVLVMDGKSEDESSAVVAEFEHIAARFYSEADKGVYDAMNKGIAKSQGEFLYFMGCDDRLAAADVLQKVFARAEIEKNDVVYGDVIFTDNGRRYDGIFDFFKLIELNICHQAIFTRRKVFELLGTYDIRYSTYADWEYNMRWFSNPTIKRAYIPIVVAFFNRTGLSSLHQDDLFDNELWWMKKKYFPTIVRYISRNTNRPLHQPIARLLTFERLMWLKKVSTFGRR